MPLRPLSLHRPSLFIEFELMSNFVPAPAPALCISIHDVAPATWPLCERLIQNVYAVAAVPLTLLVVPEFHRLPVADVAGYERALERCQIRGDELALHGYVHLDEGPPASSLRERYLREVFTTREGEFSALTASEATVRIEQGLRWFEQRGWPVSGFVAPAWLLSRGAWEALRQFPFAYTTTMGHVHLVRERRKLAAPSLTYTARNAVGRFLSSRVNDVLASAQGARPLTRLALHPADACHPELMRHCQRLVARLLEHREPMTKAAFVMREAARPSPQWMTE
ncbi:MAG: DUF2334 domain-containing protein [Burkholderiaceae bacterium]